jgi:NADH-quinone oxidoreductase subunit F
MKRLVFGTATCGVAAGALTLLEGLRQTATEEGLQLSLEQTGCLGLCYLEPLVEVFDDGRLPRLYGRVTEAVVRKLAAGVDDDETRAALVREGEGPDRDSVLPGQKRIALERCGRVTPVSLEEYRAWGGFDALLAAVKAGSPRAVLDSIKQSGLRGRGGAGFPTGRKWELAAASPGPVKYVVCNADEGDPGAFMDRSILEGDPYAVLEGMALCGYAIGATEGIIYCRAEYPRALATLREAIGRARTAGLLETDLGGFAFRIRIKEGAGAFVCGEETALMASIEGRRGMPRIRPPYPAQKGLWGAPTNINNVETLACVPWILRHGGATFAALGTEGSKGTKVFALAGKIRRGGLVEVPMGMSIRQLVLDIGGGVPGGRALKAVQMGGPSGGCLPESLLDTPIDYEKLVATGAIMGSGGCIVMDDTTCMVDVARYFLSFIQSESCGKCVFCRVGTKRLLETLERICAGGGREGDIEELTALAHKVKNGSLCGLGQTAANPVLTTLRYFRHEYEAHIKEKRCPALACAALVSYRVDADACTGCTACAKACPVAAIEGAPRKPHSIDMGKCIRCGRCHSVCPVAAVIKF